MVSLPAYLLIFVVAFLLGSIPFGLILGKLFYHTDIRTVGSGNIGTTNAARAMGKAGGTAVFLLDFGKGLLAGFLSTVIPGLFLAAPAALGHVELVMCASVAFLGCILGHVYSPWLCFRGGKGVAAAAGGLVFLFGIPGTLLMVLSFVLGILVTKRVSVGSIAAAIVCPFLAVYYCWGIPAAWALTAIAAVVVIYAHRSNIQRIRDGVEPRIGDSKK